MRKDWRHVGFPEMRLLMQKVLAGLCLLVLPAFSQKVPLVERTPEELILHVNVNTDSTTHDVYDWYDFKDEIMDFREAAMAVNHDYFQTAVSSSADFGRRYVIDLRRNGSETIYLQRYVRLQAPVRLEAGTVTVNSSSLYALITDGPDIHVKGGTFKALNGAVDASGIENVFEGCVFDMSGSTNVITECVGVSAYHGGSPAVFSNCVFRGGLYGILVGVDASARLVGGNLFTETRPIYNNGNLEISGSMLVTNAQTSINYSLIRFSGKDIVFCPSANGEMIRSGNGGRLEFAAGCQVLFDGGQGTGSGSALNSYVGTSSMYFAEGAVVSFRGKGAAILNQGSAEILSRGVSFMGISGRSQGGAIYNGGTLLVQGATFAGNSAQNAGGAIFNEGTAEIRACTFVGNECESGGGGTVFNSGHLSVKACTFYDNACGVDLLNGTGGADTSVMSSVVEGVDGGGAWTVIASLTNALSVGVYAGRVVTNVIDGGCVVTVPLNPAGPAYGVGCRLDDVVQDQLGRAFVEPVPPGALATMQPEVVVTFCAEGGVFPNGAGRMDCTRCMCYGELPSAVRSGYAFDGWFVETEAGTRCIAETDTLVADAPHVIRAHWTRLPEVEPDGPAHIHDFAYTVDESGSMLVETCACGHRACCSMELAATSFAFDGQPKAPAMVAFSGDAWLGEAPFVRYIHNVYVGAAMAVLSSGSVSLSQGFDITEPMAPIVELEVNGEALVVDANAPTSTVLDVATLWTDAPSRVTWREVDQPDVSVTFDQSVLNRGVEHEFTLPRMANDVRIPVSISWRVAGAAFTRAFQVNTLSSHLPRLEVWGESQSDCDFHLSFAEPVAIVKMATDGSVRYYRTASSSASLSDFASVVYNGSLFYSFRAGGSRIVLDAEYCPIVVDDGFPEVPEPDPVPVALGMENCLSWQIYGELAVCGWRWSSPDLDIVSESPVDDLSNPTFGIRGSFGVLQRVVKAKNEPPREEPSTVVTTADDVVDPHDMRISLREAVDYAQDGDTITFDLVTANAVQLESEIRMSRFEKKGLGIVGPVTLSGGGQCRIFNVSGRARLLLDQVTICNGSGLGSVASPGYGGGVLLNSYANVVASNCVFRSCGMRSVKQVTLRGGAVCLLSRTTGCFVNCIFENNAAITGSSSHGYGGAVFRSDTASTSFVDCGFSRNSAEYGPDVYPVLGVARETSDRHRWLYSSFAEALAAAGFGDTVIALSADSEDLAAGDVYPPGVSYRDETDSQNVLWPCMLNAAMTMMVDSLANNDYYSIRKLTTHEVSIKLNDHARSELDAITLSGDGETVVLTPSNVKPYLWYGLGRSDSPQGPFVVDTWRQADAQGNLAPFIAVTTERRGFFRIIVSMVQGGENQNR